MPPLVIVAVTAIALAIVLLVLGLMGLGTPTRSLVASNLQRGDITDLRELTLIRPTRERAWQPLASTLAGWVRRITPVGALTGIERKLVMAGRPAAWPLERVLAAKVVLGMVGVVLASARILTGANLLVTAVMIIFAVALYYTPDILLSARATERQRALLATLPDALDQMTISMDAGLGFDAALARAGHSQEGPLGQEIVRTLQEIQVGVGRQEALRSLTERTDMPDLRHFVTAVQQAETYGVPISRVLREHAAEMRRKRRQRAEEAARKLPIKLLFPMVLFIMPPLFIVLMGPAVLQLIEAFS